MMAHLARRLAWGLFVVWAVVTTAFFVNNVLPSDAARMVAGPHARPADVARIRIEMGLDRPAVEQYGVFFRRLVHVTATSGGNDRAHASCATFGPVHVDLGRSTTQRRPVVTVLAERLPRSLALAFAGLFLQVVIGAGLGVLAAVRRNTVTDHAAVGVTLLGVSAPTFLTGILLQYVFGHRLRILPLDGFGRDFGEHAASLVLPALTLGLFGAAVYTRLVRDEMIGALGQDHVRTARAKGASEAAVVLRHAFRNALVPLVTVLGLDLGALVGGAVVTETLFRWPGIGSMSVTAMLDRDGPLILGSVLVTSVGVVIVNLVVDALYVALDPRLRK